MACPKDYRNKNVTIDPVVQDHDFFSSRPVNEWTFEEYIKGSKPEDLDELFSLLSKYKQSLHSLSRMRSLDRDLKAYIGSLRNEQYSKAELRSLLPTRNSEGEPSSVTINVNESTIVAANENSSIVINNNSNRKRKGKEREEVSEDSNAEESNITEIDTTHTTPLIINNIDILSLWNRYKIDCKHYLSYGSSTVETDTIKLLSQAHIMLLKRDEIDPRLKEIVGTELIEAISLKVKQAFKMVEEVLPLEKEKGLKDIVKDLTNKVINSREASAKIMSLCSEKMDSTLDNILFAVRNFIERLPQKKYNYIIQESHLSSTFVDALIRPLIESPDNDLFLVWSNLKVQEDCAERPDLSGLALVESQFKNIICVGEVKGEDRIADNHSTLSDLMKIGCFSKDAIDKYGNKGILGVHVVGLQVTFYVTTLIAEGLYVMLEFCSIRLPSCIYDMKGFIANVEDLFPIKNVFEECMEHNESLHHYRKNGLGYKEMLRYVKLGKNRKRRCPLVVNH